MYLRELYRQNKFWFAIVILFAAAQLFINYKRGVEFSPFYHYSMFSLPFHKKEEYSVAEIRVNGRRLQAKDFTPNEWDNFMIPIIEYQQQESWNSLIYHTTIKRLLHTNDSSLYTNRISGTEFNQWYKQRVVRLLKLKDTSANVQYQIVAYCQKNNLLYRK